MTDDSGSALGEAETTWEWARRGAVFAAGCALTCSAILYFRTLFTFHASFLGILGWQAAAWLPWVAGFALGHRALDWCLAPPTRAGLYLRLGFGVVTTGAVAAAWLRLISERISPFLGAAGTHMGVFRLFFIFWFLLNGLLFALLVGWRLLLIARPAVEIRPPATIEERTEAPAEERLLLNETSGETVEVGSVIWIEARDYYSAIHTEGGKVHLVRRSMASFARQLAPKGFVRTHRSALVNLRFVARVDRAARGGRPGAVLADGTVCRVSRAGASSLRAAGMRWS